MLVLTGLLVATVAVRTGDRLRQARFEEFVEGIAQADRLGRSTACRFDRSFVIAIDLKNGTMEVRESDSQTTIAHSRQVSVDGVLIEGQRIEHDEVLLPIDRQGHTASYALRMRQPKMLSRDGERTWIAISGLSGQVSRTTDEEQAEALTAIEAPRPNTY